MVNGFLKMYHFTYLQRYSGIKYTQSAARPSPPATCWTATPPTETPYPLLSGPAAPGTSAFCCCESDSSRYVRDKILCQRLSFCVCLTSITMFSSMLSHVSEFHAFLRLRFHSMYTYPSSCWCLHLC